MPWLIGLDTSTSELSSELLIGCRKLPVCDGVPGSVLSVHGYAGLGRPGPEQGVDEALVLVLTVTGGVRVGVVLRGT